MFIPAKPYISDILWKTVSENKVQIPESELIPDEYRAQLNILSEEAFIQAYKSNENNFLYINSENAIEWINNKLIDTDLPAKIDFIKNKFKFRETLKDRFPNFYFRKITLSEFKTLNPSEIPLPVIIKPVAGFSSLGVYKLKTADDFPKVYNNILTEIEKYGESFPVEVVNLQEFILEEIIEGEEYAVDLYYNDKSEATLLMVLYHIFLNSDDMSDRLYLTSKEIITTIGSKFLDILNFTGKTIGFKNLAMHAEFRITPEGKVFPIEINPLRFAGYCTTDISHYCFNFNGYEYFFNKKKPDWDSIFKGKEDKCYALCVIDVKQDIKPAEINNFDYAGLAKVFSNPIHIRKFDYKKFPVFAFVFAEINSEEEKQMILNLDLKQFIVN